MPVYILFGSSVFAASLHRSGFMEKYLVITR